MKRMVLMLRDGLSRVGLTLHPTKCKVQANNNEFDTRGDVLLAEGFTIEVLNAGECLELLGTTISLEDPTGAEIDNRISSGWKKFWALKRLLLNRSISRTKRLRLFDYSVAECVLWGCESWTLRAEEFRRLSVVQNMMLRRIAVMGRADGEVWVDWVRRATSRIRGVAGELGLKEWGPEHFRRKWRWAGQVATTSAVEWLGKVTEWRDSAWQAAAADWGSFRPRRPSARRWMRFEDCLRRFCQERGLGGWREVASDSSTWHDRPVQAQYHSQLPSLVVV